MKKIIIRENKIVVSIILGSIIIGLSFYFGQIEKHTQQAQKINQEENIRCQKIAIDNKDTKVSFYKFEYHYNQNTGMCILAYIKNDSYGGRNYLVTDLFSGKDIYNKIGIEPGDEAVRLYNEWDHLSNLYFYQKEVRIP